MGDWNPARVSSLRTADLDMTRKEFARLLEVDVRTVTRWESVGPAPKGASAGILSGLYFALLNSYNNKAVKLWLKAHVQLGGNMASALVKLLAFIPDGWPTLHFPDSTPPQAKKKTKRRKHRPLTKYQQRSKDVEP